MKKTATLALLFALLALPACIRLPPEEPTRDTLSPAEHVMLANGYLSHGERPSAREQYDFALAKDKHYVPALLALGNMSFEENQLSQARSFFRRAFKAEPHNPAVINNLAMVDVTEGKHLDRAKALVEQALPTAGPITPYLLDTLAKIAIKQGRLADAKLALDQADAAIPKNDVLFHQHIQETRDKMNH